MQIKIVELINEGDTITLRQRHPADHAATVCRLTVVEGGQVAAEIQLTWQAIPALSAALESMLRGAP